MKRSLPTLRTRPSRRHFVPPLSKLILSLALLVWPLFGTTHAASPSPSLELAPLLTNEIEFVRRPSFVNRARLERITSRIQRAMEWDIRRVRAFGYASTAEFAAASGIQTPVRAFTRRRDQSIHFAPDVTSEEFDALLGHELVHVIVMQKYRSAIPEWIEEGLANFQAGRGRVDYRQLETQLGTAPPLRSLGHALSRGPQGVAFHYQASRSIVEMIAARCRLDDLLQMSVGKDMERFLRPLCGVEDLDREWATWVRQQAARARGQSRSK